ncbi:MAG TPA: hypothetical protein VLL48_11455, partial [Longimicrobiales bacterium]|nr:hypothetical protein [Longimicrobiales bacterium]
MTNETPPPSGDPPLRSLEEEGGGREPAADPVAPRGPGDPEGRSSGLIALGGLALFPLATLGFVQALDVSALEALLLAGLVELLPALTVAQVALAMRLQVLDRISAYTGSAVSILVIGGLSLGFGLADGGPARLGLELPPRERLAAGTGAVLA